MSYQREREAFLVRAEKEGIPLDVARKVLRYSTTLTRLAVAQCNGDWPCDNGERKVFPCGKCEGLYVRSVLLMRDKYMGGLCPDCRAENNVRALLEPYHVEPHFQGDPRGCVIKLKVPSGYGDDFGGAGLLCVPAPYL
jgi:hypothetical protein